MGMRLEDDPRRPARTGANGEVTVEPNNPHWTTLRDSPSGPFLVPQWRWLTAVALPEVCRWRKWRPDPWLRRARAYAAGKADPALAAAHRVWSGPDARARLRLEARLLAGLTPAEAAARGGLDPEVGEAYAAVFYDVARQFKATDWMLVTVVGARTLDRADTGTVVRWVAYRCGPVILEDLLAAVDAPEGVEGEADPGVRQAREYMTLLTTPADEEHYGMWMDRYYELLRLEALEAGGSAAPVTAPVEVPAGAVFDRSPSTTSVMTPDGAWPTQSCSPEADSPALAAG
jgi:hypothetical protein